MQYSTAVVTIRKEGVCSAAELYLFNFVYLQNVYIFSFCYHVFSNTVLNSIFGLMYGNVFMFLILSKYLRRLQCYYSYPPGHGRCKLVCRYL